MPRGVYGGEGPPTVCRIPGCAGGAGGGRGYCPTHYLRLTTPDLSILTEEERVRVNEPWVRERTVDVGNCWVWTRSRIGDGYGQGSPRRQQGIYERMAHRMVYRMLVGDIPDGFVVHHRCGVRPCVNPAHLFALAESSHIDHHRGSHSRVIEIKMSLREWENAS